jgi:lipoate-protein ligase B
LVNVSRKGISALQLQRELGMKSYKGAWRMMKQIRSAMAKEEMKEVFEAVVEIDETYVGGKPRKENNHNDNHPNKRGRGTSKTMTTKHMSVGLYRIKEVEVQVKLLSLE